MGNSWDGYQWYSPDGKRVLDLDERETRFKTLVIGFDNSCDYDITNYNGVDYTNNAQTVINAAINRASIILNNEGFRRILFKSGIYNLTSSINIGGLVPIILDGSGSATLKRMGNFSTGLINISIGMDVTIQNIYINGNKSEYPNTNNHGICSNDGILLMATINNCIIESCSGSGIYIWGTNINDATIFYIDIHNCYMNSNYRDIHTECVDGLWIRNCFTMLSTDRSIYVLKSKNVNINDCSISRCKISGVQVGDTIYGIISGNRVYDCESSNVFIGGSADISITNNQLENTTTGIGSGSSCVSFSSSTDILFSNNICGLATGNNIYVNNTNRMIIEGNISTRAGLDGFNFSSMGSDFTVNNNVVHSNGGRGIYFSDSIIRVTMIGNRIHDNSSHGIYCMGSQCTIDGNFIAGNNHGIYLTKNFSQCVITGNEIRDSRTHALCIMSSDVMVSGNMILTSSDSGVYITSGANNVRVIGNNLIGNTYERKIFSSDYTYELNYGRNNG